MIWMKSKHYSRIFWILIVTDQYSIFSHLFHLGCYRIVDQPFKKLQDRNSRGQYEGTLVRLLSMLLRPSDNYKLDLNPKIQKVVEDLRATLSAQPLEPVQVQKATQNLLQCIWGRTWKKTDRNTIGDPTICNLALLMLKYDGTFQSPKNTSPCISRFKYSLRLVMLIAIKRYAKRNNLDDLQACTKFEPWFKEKRDSTFNTLCTLQKYASHLARMEPGLPNVVWLDRIHYRTMRFKGHLVEFDKFTTLFSNIENQAITIWEQEVLMNLPLRVDYDQITDDMANTEVGYSLFSDRRNTCFKDRDILAKAIFADPVLHKRFLTGNLTSLGQPIWNIIELQKWLFSYSQFHGAQITSADIKGGSPSRGTEIECIQYVNSRTRFRGLYMMGNHLAILCQYHKSASITGKDKIIPHSLDAVTADLTIQDLALARPFAELAVYICYPHDFDVQRRYNSYLFINNKQLFDTPQLTKLLKGYTNPIFQVGFGVADWRHISATFRRKICPGMEDIVSDDDTQESIPALQSGHSRHTENRLYGISPDALAGASEDVLPLFLDASTDWQVACKIVPGGHLLPYRQAIASNFAQLAAGKKIKANYTTPLRTMEQVMERVIQALDTRLERQTNDIFKYIDSKLEQFFATKTTNDFDAEFNDTVDQITDVVVSSKQIFYCAHK